MLLEKPLECLITLYFVVFEPKNLKSLLFSDESTFDSKSFFSNRFSALVGEFLCLVFVVLLVNELENSFVALFDCQWANHTLKS